MADQRKELIIWLRGQVFRTNAANFILRHAATGAKGQEVDSFPVDSSLSSETIDMFADTMLMRAQTDADGLGTKLQRYIIVASVDGKDGARFPFRVRGDGDEGEDAAGEEPATPSGLLQQLMRHNEGIMRMALTTTGMTNQMLSNQLIESQKEQRKLQAQLSEQSRVIEQAKNEDHARELELLLTSGDEDRKAAVVKQLSQLVPIIMAKMTGQKLLPDGASGGVLKNFVDSLTPEQMAEIGKSLDQGQQIALVTLIKELRQN